MEAEDEAWKIVNNTAEREEVQHSVVMDVYSAMVVAKALVAFDGDDFKPHVAAVAGLILSEAHHQEAMERQDLLDQLRPNEGGPSVRSQIWELQDRELQGAKLRAARNKKGD